MKLKQIVYVALALGMTTTTVSCTGKFDEYNTNNDATTKVTPDMLATKLILDITQLGRAKNFVYDNMLNKQVAWAEGSAESNQYNQLGRVSFDTYTQFTNCQKMIMEAESASMAVQNSYQGLAKFIKAYELYNLSMKVGDIPYSDSNNGENGVIKPKYDTQKEVMRQVLEDLEEAQGLFSKGEKFGGDPIFNGSPESWRKIAAALELKVLINLSKKENDTDLDVKGRFARVAVANNLLQSNEENLQLDYADKAGQLYPLYQNDHVVFYMVSNTITEPLKKFGDYRLFYYAEPSKYQIDNGVAASEWDAYMGVDPTAVQAENNTLHADGKDCGPNKRYLRPEGEPLMRISYMEQNFILAEAALRGWINSSKASDYYKEGIRASMEFIAEHTPDNPDFHHGHPITSEYVDEYLTNPAIQLTGNFEEDLELILLQKYLGSYLQHPNNESWYDQRRTGHPVLPLNPNTNLNTDPNKFPVRWMYPQGELDYNRENVEEAINRQYGGNDDFNEVMWILQD